MLTKETETITTVLADGQLQVLTVTHIVEDGVRLSSSNHRKVIDVGDDVTNEDQLTKDIAGSVHTPERANARAAARAANNPNA